MGVVGVPCVGVPRMGVEPGGAWAWTWVAQWQLGESRMSRLQLRICYQESDQSWSADQQGAAAGETAKAGEGKQAGKRRQRASKAT